MVYEANMNCEVIQVTPFPYTRRNFQLNLNPTAKKFTLRGIPVHDDESGPDLSSRTGIPLSVNFFIRRDDESGPDSSSQTGIPVGVKFFIRWVQIQLDISLSVLLQLGLCTLLIQQCCII